MEARQDYITGSLELHLFFARIMKEHALFLSAGFPPPNARLAGEGAGFLRQFEALLSQAIALSDCTVRRCLLDAGEVFTEFTDRAECQTQRLTGIPIDRRLTARAMRLKGLDCGQAPRVSPALICQVRRLNRDALALVERLIAYKERILEGMRTCRLFSGNYPLLIEHILREARLYRSRLMELEGLRSCGCQEIRDGEPFWNQIMMEHALFIRGLLDPSEEALIQTADGFAGDYQRLLAASVSANDRTVCGAGPLALTQKFQAFKQAGVEGIENCRIRSLILPLLADHVLREANHYLRLLGD